MKVIVYLLSAILLCSCAFVPRESGSKKLKNETEQSVKQTYQIQKSTNRDVLEKMKEPQSKTIYSNGKYRYSYIYFKYSAFKPYENMQTSPFSKTVIVEIDYSDIKSTSKSLWFEFDSNNILTDMYFQNGFNNEESQVVSKYKFIDLPMKPEIERFEKLSDNEFLHKITIGMTKGSVFRIIGKPYFSNERNGKETWSYPRFTMRAFLDEQDERAIALSKNPFLEFIEVFKSLFQPKERKSIFHDPRWMTLNIVFKNDTVIDRYVSKNAELTTEEKSYIER